MPLFTERGLLRYPDYAANNSHAVGMNCIPLQRRSGDKWPTIEIRFDKRQRPFLGLTFSELPEHCHRLLPGEERAIPRLQANAVEGDAFFALTKGSPAISIATSGIDGSRCDPRTSLTNNVHCCVRAARGCSKGSMKDSRRHGTKRGRVTSIHMPS